MGTREEYVLNRVAQGLFDASETVRLYLTEAAASLPGFEQLFRSLLQADTDRKVLAMREYAKADRAHLPESWNI